MEISNIIYFLLRYTKNLIRNNLKFIQRHTFRFAEKYFKIDITPVHYYSPIPDTSKLGADVFKKISKCHGLDFNVKLQMDYLKLVASKYINEYVPPVNSGLSLVDASVLYSMIRSYKLKVIIEIGSGESTKINLEALNRYREEGFGGDLAAVEPFPKKYINKYIKKIHEKNFDLIEKSLGN